MSPLSRIHFLQYFPCFLRRGTIPNILLLRWFHRQNNPGEDLPVVCVPYLLVPSRRYRGWIARPWFRTIDKAPIFMCFQQHSPIQRPCPIIPTTFRQSYHTGKKPCHCIRLTCHFCLLLLVAQSLFQILMSNPNPYAQLRCGSSPFLFTSAASNPIAVFVHECRSNPIAQLRCGSSPFLFTSAASNPQ